MNPIAKPKGRTTKAAAQWLLLVYQLPPKPAYLRVKVWRRLQELGAISLKNSVYVLPSSEQTREDFEWLLREIDRDGGEGVICKAHVVDGMSDQQIRGLFDTARDVDYAEIAEELRKLAAPIRYRDAARQRSRSELKSQVAKLRRRLSNVSAVDFFGATGRLTAEALLRDLEAQLATPSPARAKRGAGKALSGDLIGKIWVTRRDVHIDRVACAWLIRRFVDPDARFKFVSMKDYRARPGELRFDMFRAEFTHEGDRCTFEVMLERFGLQDRALQAIAEIVHDIDLKDGKFGREHAAGIAHVVAGLCITQEKDLARIDRASALFDDAYEEFKRRRPR